MTDITNMASVVAVSPNLIQIEVSSTDDYAQLDQQLEIGSYLKISDDGGSAVVAIVQSYRIRDDAGTTDSTTISTPKFIVDAQPVGRLEDGRFRRGGKQITIPPKHVEIASSHLLGEIYDTVGSNKKFSFGTLAQDSAVRVVVDGDKFFGKHIGVVGSTGAGKSCTVAKILQEGIQPSDDQVTRSVLNNSHIIIFDLHGEYKPAFPTARVMGVDELRLPHWLMDSEELEEMFIESNEENSHNQVSQFRQAVIENKERHAGSATGRISYDSPVYFSLMEVINYLHNLNNEVIGKLEGESLPKLADGTLIHKRADHYFDTVLDFVAATTAKDSKASNGPFHGEFNRFLMRLEGRLADRRLDFLLAPLKLDGGGYMTSDFTALLQYFTGYGKAEPNKAEANVTIIDLSGVPFEVLSVVVSLMTRIIFTF